MCSEIEILCGVTCIYEDKKLAIICPLGKIVEKTENFDAKYLAMRFSKDIDKAYPFEALVEVDQMIAPIVNRFGRIPDKSFASIEGIRCATTGEDLPALKNEIDEIYKTSSELKERGYNFYGVYYVEHNIDEFTDDSDIPFCEDSAILTIEANKYNLESLISYTFNNFKLINLNKITKFYNECLIDNDYCDLFYNKDIFNLDNINHFFSKVTEGSIYIPFATQEKGNIISLGNGEEIDISSINIGEIVFTTYNEYGISIDLIDGKYIINEVENVINNGIDSISIIEDGGNLTDRLIETVEKFII